MKSSREKAADLHAAGRIATNDMRPVLGARQLRAALRLLDNDPTLQAVKAAPDEQRGRILVSLAHAEAEQGHIEEGWRLLAEAERQLPAARQGALFNQRGLLFKRTGKDDLALQQYDRAVELLDQQHEPEDLARALLNRGNLHLSSGWVRLARADLRRCAEIASEHGFVRIRPMARHSLAFLDFLAGDLPAALQAYRSLAQQYENVKPGILPVLALDRGRALMAAGLFAAADRELASAHEQFLRRRLGQDCAEAELARAEAALLAGKAAIASRWAARARSRFLRRDNQRWAALASLLALRARYEGRHPPSRLVDEARALTETLRGLGLAEDARVAGMLAARGLVRDHRMAAGQAVLSTCGPPQRSDRLDTSLLWRLTQAELATATGRPKEAMRHLGAGLTQLQRHRSQLGCLDLQTGAAVHGRELANAGLALALSSGSIAEVYRWSERMRAQTLLLPPVRPPDDPDAAAALEEFRQVRQALREAELAGRPTGGLRARSDVLQRTIREHAWSAAGPGMAGKPASFSSVKEALADAAMVIYLRGGPLLHALVLLEGTASLVPIGGYAAAEEALLRLRADLDARAGRALPRRLTESVAAATQRDAASLAALLVDPLVRSIADRDLVVVPTGLLVTVPWAVVPGCVGRPVTVAPSASAWISARGRLQAMANGVDGSTSLLVSGPGNDRGEAEVHEIGALQPYATTLTGRKATPDATLAALNGVAIAHLAAHGHHEADNALFSTLDLVGGPLMGYDIQRLDRVPTMVVLSSCELGLSDVRPGDETLGMTTALLTAGSGTVIASVSRVADETARTMMTSYHRAVSHGQSPAAALAEAASADSPTGFVCFGAG